MSGNARHHCRTGEHFTGGGGQTRVYPGLNEEQSEHCCSSYARMQRVGARLADSSEASNLG